VQSSQIGQSQFGLNLNGLPGRLHRGAEKAKKWGQKHKSRRFSCRHFSACRPDFQLLFSTIMRRLWHIREQTENLPSVFRHDFFGGVGWPLVTANQWLATETFPQNRKNAKKSAK